MIGWDRLLRRPDLLNGRDVGVRPAFAISSLLIEDSGGADLPMSLPGQLVAATATSVAVCCASSAATEVVVGDSSLPLAGAMAPVFDGRVATPTRKLAVRTILGATLMEVTVRSIETHVRIWTNAGAEPTKLAIGADGAGGAVAR